MNKPKLVAISLYKESHRRQYNIAKRIQKLGGTLFSKRVKSLLWFGFTEEGYKEYRRRIYASKTNRN